MNFLCQVHVYVSCTLCNLETACTMCTPNILSMFTYFIGNTIQITANKNQSNALICDVVTAAFNSLS